MRFSCSEEFAIVAGPVGNPRRQRRRAGAAREMRRWFVTLVHGEPLMDTACPVPGTKLVQCRRWPYYMIAHLQRFRPSKLAWNAPSCILGTPWLIY